MTHKKKISHTMPLSDFAGYPLSGMILTLNFIYFLKGSGHASYRIPLDESSKINKREKTTLISVAIVHFRENRITNACENYLIKCYIEKYKYS